MNSPFPWKIGAGRYLLDAKDHQIAVFDKDDDWEKEQDSNKELILSLDILQKKALLFDEFMKLCTDSSPVDFMKNLGELYQKGLKL